MKKDKVSRETKKGPANGDGTSPMPFTDAQFASGDWNPIWEKLRDVDPQFLEGYLAFRNVPFKYGPLNPKYKELILIAINVATTHMYAPGVRRHIKNALKHGATQAEIMETIELTTVLGIHACNIGVPILLEEIAKADSESSSNVAGQSSSKHARTTGKR